MAHHPTACLLAGLKEQTEKLNTMPEYAASFELGYLASMVGQMLCAEGDDKRRHRASLAKMLGRGRCILNARDLAARQVEGGAK